MAKKMVDEFGLAGLYGLMDPGMNEVAKIIAETDMSKKVTGRLMVMHQNKMGDGKRIICAMFGVVAVPVGQVKDMHLYPLVGTTRSNHLNILFSTQEGQDRSDMSGYGVSDDKEKRHDGWGN